MISMCIITLQNCYLSAVYGIKDILECANDYYDGAFEVSLMDVRQFCASRKRFCFVVLPPFRTGAAMDTLAPDKSFVAALKRAIARGSIPVSVCAGAFYLCATGVADGGTVTTHWKLADALSLRYPAVSVNRERVLIDRGKYITAGGVTSFQDLSLHLVKKCVSAETALEVARTFLISPGDRTQLQYVKNRIDESGMDDPISVAKAFIRERLSEDISLQAIAAHCALTVRTMLRYFKAAGEGSPGQFLQAARIAHARVLLETSGFPIKHVADEAGYRDVAAFARAFRKLTGLAPGEYRKRFYSP